MVWPHEPERLWIWRLSNYRDLSGRGGLRVAGRWHSVGHLIVYCSDARRTAYLELTGRLGVEAPYLLPDSYALLEILVPKSVSRDRLPHASLPDGWDSAQQDGGYVLCQPIGNAWLRDGATALRWVPSTRDPVGENVLINPAHRHADYLQIAQVHEQPFAPGFFD
jgi:RES domain-containing protein